MKILLIHLSDIHFNNQEDLVLSRINQLSNAINSVSFEIQTFIVVISGDIANYGLNSQYKIAQSFLEDIKRKLINETNKQIHFVVVPGNHDCNLKEDQSKLDVRESVLQVIPNKIESLKIEDGNIKSCVNVQDNFFKFAAELTSTEILIDGNRIFFQHKIQVDGYSVRFDCYNTSWVSQIKERQGELYFPTQIPEHIINQNVKKEFVISTFHHPYNWLESNNARKFRLLVEKNSDLILTGHEHYDEHFIKRNQNEIDNHYLSGDVLQETDKRDSGFNIVLVDLKEEKFKIENFKWIEGIYKKKTEGSWESFQRDRLQIAKGLFTKPSFEQWLADIGTAFIHPFKKSNISLSDLFTYPNLKRSDNTTFFTKTVKGDQVFQDLWQNKFSLILGEENSGKTTLAKKLYSDFRSKGLIPFFYHIDENFKNVTEDDFRKSVSKQFADQFSYDKEDVFWQLNVNQRVLIVDDLHKIKLNRLSIFKIINLWKKMFGHIVLFANDLFKLQFFAFADSDSDEESDGMSQISLYEILPCNHSTRGKLIKSWIKLGREHELDTHDFLKEEREKEKLIEPFFNRRFVPSYPFWVISILQLITSGQGASN
nr:metallophosphoesterase [Pyrinomonadaceae bacterium]